MKLFRVKVAVEAVIQKLIRLTQRFPDMKKAKEKATKRNIACNVGPVAIYVKLWTYGNIRLMTHISHHHYMGLCFRVSEETTGYGIPDSYGSTQEFAEEFAVFSIKRYGKKLGALIKKCPVINPRKPNRAERNL